MSNKGSIIVLSAPSGTGKSTIVRLLCQRSSHVIHSISCTTRPARREEKEGREYFFLSEDEFQKRIDAGDFVEWARVHGFCYGTPRAPLEQALAQGNDVLLDIDVVGAMAVKQAYPEAVTIFLLPPRIEDLEERLIGRGTENSDERERRLKHAHAELMWKDRYDHVITNDSLERAVTEILSLMHRTRTQRQTV